MITVFAIWVLLLSLLAWAGQMMAWITPRLAESLGLSERESDVDPAFHEDGNAECIIDTFTLWPLTVAAVLLLVDSSLWAPFGLAGGAIYVYFAGRGILQRIKLNSRGIKTGSQSNMKAAYLFLSLWGLTGLCTCALSATQWFQRSSL